MKRVRAFTEPGRCSGLLLRFAAPLLLSAAFAGCDAGSNSEASGLSEEDVLRLVRTLTGSQPSVVTNSPEYRRIKSAGRVAQAPLIAVLQDPAEHTDVRKWAARLLGSVGDLDIVLPALLAVFEPGGPYAWWHRSEASSGLRALWRRQSVTVTLSYFTHANAEARRTAAGSFWFEMNADNRDERVYDGLVNLLLYDPDSGVRSAAINPLADMVRPTDAIAPFVQALTTENFSWTRGTAATALGRIGNVAAVDALIGALVRPDESVYTIGDIAEALGRIGDTRAVEPLLQLLFVPRIVDTTFVLGDIVGALGELADPRAVDPLIQLLAQTGDSTVLDEILRAFGRIGDSRAVAPTAAVLQNTAYRAYVRELAARTLGEIGDPAALPVLEFVRDNDPEATVRKAAEDAIAAIVGTALTTAGHCVPQRMLA